MGRRKTDAETCARIAEMHLANADMSYAEIAEHFGVSKAVVQRVVAKMDGITAEEADRKHAEVMAEKHSHPRTSDWMKHVTSLNRRKQELEAKIAQKQDELRKAQQEYRDFLATLEQLMKEEV